MLTLPLHSKLYCVALQNRLICFILVEPSTPKVDFHNHMKDKMKSHNSTIVTSTDNSCGNCVFPFIFNGRIHDSCTTIDGDSTPWCSKSYEYSGQWEYCIESTCPGTSTATTQQPSVNPDNAAGSCCKICQKTIISISLYLLLLDCGIPNRANMDQRIVGGVPSEAAEYPWQVKAYILKTVRNFVL